MAVIYYAEDDPAIRELVLYALNSSGFEASGYENGEILLDEVYRKKPDLVLLDIMLPGRDGVSILKELRTETAIGFIPVIMLSAKGAEYDKVIGLDNGADDYITKPFGIMELISRVKAVLRRFKTNIATQDELNAEDIRIDISKHIAYASGKEVTLTLKEFELLHILMLNKGKVLTRQRLMDSIWGFDFAGETRTVDVHIATLRQKLGESGSLIETVRGLGYRIGERK